MFNPVGNKELLSMKVAEEIEEAINSKILNPGDRLPTELELCEQFAVSRTAVREALRTLSAKGLISVEKGRGIFVRKISSDSVSNPLKNYLLYHSGSSYILDIVEARLIIEPEIARYAALNRTSEDIERINEALNKLKSFSGSAAELAGVDMEFHVSIAKATKNKVLPLMLKPIFNLMPEIKSRIIHDIPDAINSAVVWHQYILDAIIEGNSDKAHDLMKEHLTIAKKHAKEMIRIEKIK
ncbi:GntR family transcriptional regulator [Melioribacter roseus P3M-2]|uniref:GntR family transcriptional regulator n=1 Tax=Melioribacter roseus (strain DSM 23840 / JCM 17771 / VKM B-2668 / P3M-2) TaxID=1191523 RepID=I6YVK4_MELRP|nr:FadR/GntR family transcriptional regulator [Melioribacter roseus]AFN74592.1 GntR family transcriptional regulator [Melioribacter roseus P3M-2]